MSNTQRLSSSNSIPREEQLGGRGANEVRTANVKIGREPGLDLGHAQAAREEIAPDARGFVDANGARFRFTAPRRFMQLSTRQGRALHC